MLRTSRAQSPDVLSEPAQCGSPTDYEANSLIAGLCKNAGRRFRVQVEYLLASTHGMSKNVDDLSAKFSGVTKKHLEHRIREVADYEGGRWQVRSCIHLHCSYSAFPSKLPFLEDWGISKLTSSRFTPQHLISTNFRTHLLVWNQQLVRKRLFEWVTAVEL